MPQIGILINSLPLLSPLLITNYPLLITRHLAESTENRYNITITVPPQSPQAVSPG